MSDLKQLSQLANELLGAQESILALEAQLAEVQRRAVHLSEHAIPELMQEFGFTDFTTDEGMSIKVANAIHAHIAEARKDAAFNWLDANGHGGMIKRRVVVGFGKESEDKARELAEALGDDGYAVKTEREVHASTLKAWVRQQLEDGEDIPLDVFGVQVQRITKVKK